MDAKVVLYTETDHFLCKRSRFTVYCQSVVMAVFVEELSFLRLLSVVSVRYIHSKWSRSKRVRQEDSNVRFSSCFQSNLQTINFIDVSRRTKLFWSEMAVGHLSITCRVNHLLDELLVDCSLTFMVTSGSHSKCSLLLVASAFEIAVQWITLTRRHTVGMRRVGAKVQRFS